MNPTFTQKDPFGKVKSANNFKKRLNSNAKTKPCKNTKNMRVKRKPAAEKLDRSVSCAVTAVNIKGTTIKNDK